VRPFFSLIGTLALCVSSASGVSPADVTTVDGIAVTRGPSTLIPEVDTAMAFQFADGRIVVGKGAKSVWSSDGGKTWKPGPAGPSEKVAIDLGGGEILAINRNTKRRDDGLFTVKLKRSLDNWDSIKGEEALLDLPGAGQTVLGGGGVVDGYLFHHGIVQLPDGRLVATVYGNNLGDTVLCDGYPEELGQKKYRTAVVFSDDRGRSWGGAVQVAYDRMLGRGVPKGHPMSDEDAPEGGEETVASVPAITQEGFREADLAIAPNGDLLCVMRSGGRNGGPAVLFPTPLYVSRSSDQGKTWSLPAQAADRGVSPDVLVLDNGIIVCTYSRPGNWLMFSEDAGMTWKGAFQFGETGAYNYLAKTGSDSFIVFHEVRETLGTRVRGSHFRALKLTALSNPRVK
jgi:hypothetical protein